MLIGFNFEGCFAFERLADYSSHKISIVLGLPNPERRRLGSSNPTALNPTVSPARIIRRTVILVLPPIQGSLQDKHENMLILGRHSGWGKLIHRQ
jgi:hypothetical protein